MFAVDKDLGRGVVLDVWVNLHVEIFGQGATRSVSLVTGYSRFPKDAPGARMVSHSRNAESSHCGFSTAGA